MKSLWVIAIFIVTMGMTFAKAPRATENEPEYYEVQNLRNGCEYMLERMIACDEKIYLSFPAQMTEDEIAKIVSLPCEYRFGSVGTSYKRKDGKLLYTITPDYKSCLRMLKHFRDPDSIELKPKEKLALEEAKRVVNEVRAEEKEDVIAKMSSANRWQNYSDDQASHTLMAKALHDWLVMHVEYDHASLGKASPGEESSEKYSCYDGKFMFLEHRGVCDSYAQAYWLLLQMSGIPCSMMSGNIKGRANGSHAWNLVLLDDHWGHVDTTWDDPGNNAEGPKYAYFDRNDEELEDSREWEQDLFPNSEFNSLFSSENELIVFETMQQFSHYFRSINPKEDMDFTVVVHELQGLKDFDRRIREACAQYYPGSSVSCAQDPLFPQAIRVKYRVGKNTASKKKKKPNK